MKQFGRNLLDAMNNRRLSQSDLARRATKKLGKQFGRDSISQYVRGLSLPNVERLQVLAEVLEVSTTDLLPTPPENECTDLPIVKVKASEDDAYNLVDIRNFPIRRDKMSRLFEIIYGD
jgi:transcriptional regulator with XRE-family HTH domain